MRKAKNRILFTEDDLMDVVDRITKNILLIEKEKKNPKAQDIHIGLKKDNICILKLSEFYNSDDQWKWDVIIKNSKIESDGKGGSIMYINKPKAIYEINKKMQSNK